MEKIDFFFLWAYKTTCRFPSKTADEATDKRRVDLPFFMTDNLSALKTTCHFFLEWEIRLVVYIVFFMLITRFSSVQTHSSTRKPTRFKFHHPNTVLTLSNLKITINPMTLWFMISNCTKKFKIEKPKIKIINGCIRGFLQFLKNHL